MRHETRNHIEKLERRVGFVLEKIGRGQSLSLAPRISYIEIQAVIDNERVGRPNFEAARRIHKNLLIVEPGTSTERLCNEDFNHTKRQSSIHLLPTYRHTITLIRCITCCGQRQN